MSNYFYVISPVATDPSFYEKSAILRDLAFPFALKPFFPLQEREGFDLAEAISDIVNARFVLADLSFERPSCYFELGIAEAVAAPTSLLAASGTPIHQVRDREMVRYFRDLGEYRDEITRILTAKNQLPALGFSSGVVATLRQ